MRLWVCREEQLHGKEGGGRRGGGGGGGERKGKRERVGDRDESM